MPYCFMQPKWRQSPPLGWIPPCMLIPLPVRHWPPPPHIPTRDCMTKNEMYNVAISAIGGEKVWINITTPGLEWLSANYRIESVSGNSDNFIVSARGAFSGDLVNLNSDDMCLLEYT